MFLTLRREDAEWVAREGRDGDNIRNRSKHYAFVTKRTPRLCASALNSKPVYYTMKTLFYRCRAEIDDHSQLELFQP